MRVAIYARRMPARKLVTVWEVLADTDQLGPAGDGTVVFRFRSQREAAAFAAKNTCYGRPCEASSVGRPEDDGGAMGCRVTKSTGPSSIAFFIALNTWRATLPAMSAREREARVEAWIRGWAAGAVRR